MTRVLVTGARGFVGRYTTKSLAAAGADVLMALRAGQSTAIGGVALVGPESTPEQMRAALEGIDAVVHLAALVHDRSERTSALDYQRINCDYPLALARAAADVRVARFVFVSTIKVNGDSSGPGQRFSEKSSVAPHGAYAESKWRAERGLRELSATTGLSARIVRPPLVYGAGVRANFLSLMRSVKRGVPLPFGSTNNERSLLYVENLADVLTRLALQANPARDFRTYLVADGEDLSTRDLVLRLARALGVRPRLLPVPIPVLRGALALLGRSGPAERLLGSLQVDSGFVRADLGWQPPFSLTDGLARTAAWLNEGGC